MDEKTCTICEKKLGSKASLKRHIMTIHLTTPTRHKCPICYQTFTRKDAVKKHTESFHEIFLEDFVDDSTISWKQAAATPKSNHPPIEATPAKSRNLFRTKETIRKLNHLYLIIICLL